MYRSPFFIDPAIAVNPANAEIDEKQLPMLLAAANASSSSSSASSSSVIGNEIDDGAVLPFSGRKTHVVCTIGPKTNDPEVLSQLIQAGMNIARLNFSHGSYEYHGSVVANVREAVKRTGMVCAILLDTKGPEIRSGKLVGGQVALTAGQKLIITTDKTHIGTSEKIAVDYTNLPKQVKVGSVIKIDDGLIICKVEEVTETEVIVRVENSAILGETKGVNLPGTTVDLPSVTQKDKQDLLFGVEQGVDFIAASFVRKAEDILEIRRVLGEKGEHIKIISKIESQEGIDNFLSILDVSDGIMVARGDLGVEIPIQKVCMAQKMMIRRCNIAGKPVITATQMLESMVQNPRPTRAEVSDVANAVFDGSDCVMLSGETAKGAYPIETVRTMAEICRITERAVDYPSVFLSILSHTPRPLSKAEAIASSGVKTAIDLGASLIVVLTETGSSARMVAKYKPAVPVVVLTTSQVTVRQCLVSRALFPILVQKGKSEDVLLDRALELAKIKKWVKVGDPVVVVSGMRAGVAGATDTLKVLDVS